MIYLVTGGAGFIGSHLVEELQEYQHGVVVIDDLSTGNLQNIRNGDQCQVCTEKIQDSEFDRLGRIDGIFHLAAQSSVPLSIEDFYRSSENNVLGALRVLDLARIRNVPVVYASSSAVYGELPEGDDGSDVVDLGSPYAVDKFLLENYARMAHQLFGIASIGLRFFNIYGPRQDPHSPYSGVIPIFIEKVIGEKKVTVNGGRQTRDFVYVKDAVKVARKAMEILSTGGRCERVNVCTGKSITIDGLLHTIAKIIEIAPEVEYKQLPPGDPEKSLGTTGRMSCLFDMCVDEFTELETGLTATIEYSMRGHQREGTKEM